MKKIAVINDISGFGKCSLGVALPIISAMQMQCCPLPTGVFSNQTGYPHYRSADLTKYLPSFIEEWQKLGAKFDGIITGFIPNSAQGDIISDFIDKFGGDGTIVLVDPVMGDNGELYPCYDEAGINTVCKIVQKADIITPNLTELCHIAGRKYADITALGNDDMLTTIYEMCRDTGKKVVVTGIPTSDRTIGTAVYEDDRINLIRAEKIGGSFSGTGDILASIVCAGAVKGMTLCDATGMAVQFISRSIAHTIKNADDRYTSADGIDFEKYLHTLVTDNE